jgi:hypothetical protein
MEDILKNWKNKCGIQAMICYQSSIYYAFMNVFFGVPPIIMNSILLSSSSYFNEPLAVSILQASSIILGSIHVYCDFAGLSVKFKHSYEKYASIKRDIDIQEVLHLSNDDLLKKIYSIKDEMEKIKRDTDPPPWIIYRRFNEASELVNAVSLSANVE